MLTHPISEFKNKPVVISDPALDAARRQPRAKGCGVSRAVGNPTTGKVHVTRTRCRCWTCQMCRALNVLAWRRRLGQLLAECDVIGMAEIPAKSVSKVTAAIRRAGGCYRSIAMAGRKRLVVASVLVEPLQVVGLDEAVARIGQALENVPLGVAKPCTGSRIWALPRKAKAEDNDAVSLGTVRFEAAAEVLAEIGATVQRRQGKASDGYLESLLAMLPADWRSAEKMAELRGLLYRRRSCSRSSLYSPTSLPQDESAAVAGRICPVQGDEAPFRAAG